MTFHRFAVLFVVLAILGMVATGCGGESDEGGASAGNEAGETANEAPGDVGSEAKGEGAAEDTTTVEEGDLAKAQFVERANKICEEGSAELLEKLTAYMRREGSKSDRPPAEQVAVGVRAVMLPEVERQIDQIRRLGAPAGEEAQIEAFLAAMRRSVRTLAEMKELSLESDLAPAFEESGQLATEYGLTNCAYG